MSIQLDTFTLKFLDLVDLSGLFRAIVEGKEKRVLRNYVLNALPFPSVIKFSRGRAAVYFGSFCEG